MFYTYVYLLLNSCHCWTFILKGYGGTAVVFQFVLTEVRNPVWRKGCGYADICKPEVWVWEDRSQADRQRPQVFRSNSETCNLLRR